jgi:hypothetical protein
MPTPPRLVVVVLHHQTTQPVWTVVPVVVVLHHQTTPPVWTVVPVVVVVHQTTPPVWTVVPVAVHQTTLFHLFQHTGQITGSGLHLFRIRHHVHE